jgi:hypothetical protein
MKKIWIFAEQSRVRFTRPSMSFWLKPEHLPPGGDNRRNLGADYSAGAVLKKSEPTRYSVPPTENWQLIIRVFHP